MKSGKVTGALFALAMVGGLGACNPFTRIDGTSPSALSKLDGSWTVINTGGTEVKGLEPAPVIVFDTATSNVSGFDGCNNFKGSYTFEDGLLKAKVAGTRKACTGDMARTISTRISDLFTQGAQVVDTNFMSANVLMLKNDNGDIRMAPTAVLEQDKASK